MATETTADHSMGGNSTANLFGGRSSKVVRRYLTILLRKETKQQPRPNTTVLLPRNPKLTERLQALNTVCKTDHSWLLLPKLSHSQSNGLTLGQAEPTQQATVWKEKYGLAKNISYKNGSGIRSDDLRQVKRTNTHVDEEARENGPSLDPARNKPENQQPENRRCTGGCGHATWSVFPLAVDQSTAVFTSPYPASRSAGAETHTNRQRLPSIGSANPEENTTSDVSVECQTEGVCERGRGSSLTGPAALTPGGGPEGVGPGGMVGAVTTPTPMEAVRMITTGRAAGRGDPAAPPAGKVRILGSTRTSSSSAKHQRGSSVPPPLPTWGSSRNLTQQYVRVVVKTHLPGNRYVNTNRQHQGVGSEENIELKCNTTCVKI